MVTVVYIDDLHGITYHRLMVPLLRLTENGFNFHWIDKLSDLKKMDLDKVDNLIVSRMARIQGHDEFKRMLKKHGIKLILDNDDYWELDKHNPAFFAYSTALRHDIKNTIKIADVIWTPSAILATEMAKLNRKAEIEIVNNAINEYEPQWADWKKTTGRELHFGYMGAAAHGKDARLMRYEFYGKNFACLRKLGYERIFKPNKVWEPKGIQEYGSFYKEIDVSIAPLELNRFNMCKSDLKVTEAAWTRTALIASNVTPYRQSIKNGETGILCSSPQEWKEAIDSMTKKRARELGENLYEDLKNSPDHNLDLVNQKRIKYLI
jgi:glycosyltransferase involved in cell wall biosynthesis